MLDTPNGSFVRSHFIESHVAFLWVIGLKIKDVELGLKGGHTDFVHGDIRAVKFYATNSILNIGVPTKAIGFQIKNFDITIIITASNNPLLLIISITEAYCPAIRLNHLGVCRLERYDRGFLSGIPNSYATICSTCHKFRSTILGSFSTNTIDAISHRRMGLNIILALSIFNIKDLKFAFVINSRDISC